MTEKLPDYLAELNPDQLKAAQTLAGPVLIQAGAGSGKTRTVIARIHNLVDHGVDPKNILAITFTNKAANELKARLPKEARQVRASTIHAFCAFLLRRLPHLPEYTSAFQIVDEDDQKSIIRKAKEDFFEKNPEMNEDLRKQFQDLRIKTEVDYVSKAIFDEHHDTSERFNYLRKQHLDMYEDFYETIATYYRDYLLKQNMMDYDGLLYNAVRLFKEHPEDLAVAHDAFHYISVDEYQDVSDIQEELITQLADTPEHNICVVGDPNQSIYGWRGAQVRNILNFKDKYDDVKVITIMKNYRSTQSILNVANNVIGYNRRALTVNPKLDAVQPDGPKPLVVQNYNGYEEANYVIMKIKEAIAKGVKPNQIAILYRTNSLSRLFEQALVKNGIKYNIVGSLNFYDRMEVKDLIAYLKLISNKQNDLSFTRIINTPSRHIGTMTVNALSDFAKKQSPQISMFNAASVANQVLKPNGQPLSPNTANMLMNFAQYINQFQLDQPGTVYDVLTKIGKDFYLAYVTELDQKEPPREGSRVDNVQQLFSAAQEFDSSHPTMPLNQALILFLQEAVLNSDSSEDDENHVQLMTVHSAKGLEFDTVFVVGLEDQIFPSSYATKKTMPEERRLFYVAATRAKRHLYLSYANERTLWGRSQMSKRSVFLSEVGENNVEEINNDHYGEIRAGQVFG